MLKGMKRPSHARRHRFSSFDFHSEKPFCVGTDGRVLTGSDGSVARSETSAERSFWFGRRTLHRSDPHVVKSTGQMPDWMTVQGIEIYESHHRTRSIPNFLAGSTLGYAHEAYEAAADIFERLAVRKPEGECLVSFPALNDNAAPPKFGSERMKRQAYELAYETLKYQQLLEEILVDSGYFFTHPSSEDTSALILVMLFDFQNRKWLPRCRVIGEIFSQEVAEVEENLIEHRIRLAAALARCRVKNQALSIDYILPEDVRKQEKCASSLPQYGWVNTLKASVEDVIVNIEEHQYIEFLDNLVLIPRRGKYYRRDQHCENVLIFPGDQKEILKALNVVEKGLFVLQDKTSSLAAKSLGALLTEDDECDLIHADVAAGLTTAHLATILSRMTKKRQEAKEMMFRPSPPAFQFPPSSTPTYRTVGLASPKDTHPEEPTVFAFGVRDDAHMERLQRLYDKMNIKNVLLSKEKFEQLNPKQGNRFDRVKAILVTPQCTRTAVANPIEFMLNEGDRETYDVLRDLSHGERHKKAVEAGQTHTETLKAALKFPNVSAVVYVTRSIHGHENEQVVNTAIKWHQEYMEGAKPFKVSPPTLPLLSRDMREMDRRSSNSTSSLNIQRTSGGSDSLKHNFLRMRQTTQMNGCFIAVISREVDMSDTAAVKEVLRRAALQGLIAPIGSPTSSLTALGTTQPSVIVDEKLEEKEKPHKTKIGFGKRVKEKSASHHAIPGPIKPQHHSKADQHKGPAKPIEAVDVNKLVESYQKAQSEKADKQQAVEPETDAKKVVNTYTFGTVNFGVSSTPAKKTPETQKTAPTSAQSSGRRSVPRDEKK